MLIIMIIRRAALKSITRLVDSIPGDRGDTCATDYTRHETYSYPVQDKHTPAGSVGWKMITKATKAT